MKKSIIFVICFISCFFLLSCEPGISKNEHICNWVLMETINPTCTETGIKSFKCSICEKVKTEEIPSTGHTPIEGESKVIQPTCSEEGYTLLKCKNCDEYYTDVTSYVSALGHILSNEEYDSYPPTCTEKGYTRRICTRCELPVIDESSYINELGHSLGDGIITKESTCSEFGEKTYHCSVCDADVIELIPKLFHQWDEGIVLEDYSCSSTGMDIYKCKNCDATTNRETKAAHHWQLNKSSGVMECSICGHAMQVGDIGPAGGYVFYDKGRYLDGWRYIEAAPNDLRVINGVPYADSFADGYDASNGTLVSLFAVEAYYHDDEFRYSNGTSTFDSNCTSPDIGKGKQNTDSLYELVKDRPKAAIQYCKELHCNGYSDWFIPSFEELKQLKTALFDPFSYGNRKIIFSDDYGDYLSSTESSNSPRFVCGLRFYSYWEFDSLRMYYDDHGNGGMGLQCVRPCRYL